MVRRWFTYVKIVLHWHPIYCKESGIPFVLLSRSSRLFSRQKISVKCLLFQLCSIFQKASLFFFNLTFSFFPSLSLFFNRFNLIQLSSIVLAAWNLIRRLSLSPPYEDVISFWIYFVLSFKPSSFWRQLCVDNSVDNANYTRCSSKWMNNARTNNKWIVCRVIVMNVCPVRFCILNLLCPKPETFEILCPNGTLWVVCWCVECSLLLTSDEINEVM